MEDNWGNWGLMAALGRARLLKGDLAFTFESFDPGRTGGPAVLELCRSYAEKMEPKMGVGLLLWGPRGVGKTHLATAILLHALGRGFEAVKIPFTDLLSAARSFFETDDLENFLSLAESDLVLLDDLSAQTIAGSFDQARACEGLFRFLDICSQHRTNLLVTTNHAPKELAAELRRLDGSERILDRLRGLVHEVYVGGKSQRSAEKLKRTPPWLREALAKVKEEKNENHA